MAAASRALQALATLLILSSAAAHPLQLGPYQPPGPTDQRSPCPAFNTMANHGVFPRDGSPVKLGTILRAFRKFLSVSFSMSMFFYAGATVAQLDENHMVDPVKLRIHNRIEHDVSLVRDDIALGNNWLVNDTLVDQMLTFSSDGQFLTARDVANYRSARLEFSKTHNPSYTFDLVHRVIANGESGLLLLCFGDPLRRSAIPLAHIEAFIRKETMPDGYRPPLVPVTPGRVAGMVAKLKVYERLNGSKPLQ
eukprot:TRINITY_DN436_c0_g2_i1.p2 TRINITY_DN436_c0_g2~~TRINITY_DN436_c0_g2_i1.p2  ORF type:complete len:251 (+),score=-6.46 TRINITY_DN436_c0_g2_i1:255-1007(+)